MKYFVKSNFCYIVSAFTIKPNNFITFINGLQIMTLENICKDQRIWLKFSSTSYEAYIYS